MLDFRRDGLVPYQIPGGGHSPLGAVTYADAVEELAQQCSGQQPDVIVVASGTGTTQAGLLAGIERRGWTTRVIGISVARKNPRGHDVTREAYQEARQHLNLIGDPLPVEVRDDWIGPGYEICESATLD